MRSALVAGALLAFALSFDEIVVTTFTAGAGTQTLPLWIFNNLARPNAAPVVNVVAVSIIMLSLIPVCLAQRLSRTPVRRTRLPPATEPCRMIFRRTRPMVENMRHSDGSIAESPLVVVTPDQVHEVLSDMC